MQVATIMTPDPVCVECDTELDRAMALMDEHSIRHLPVLDAGELVGVVSDRDLLEETGWSVERAQESETKRVGDIMHSNVVSLAPDDTLVLASLEIVLRGIGCLPVVDQKKIVGILTDTDLLRTYEQACARGQLVDKEDPPVSLHLSGTLRTLQPGDTLSDAVDCCRVHGVRHIIVTRDNHLLSILSDRDIRRAYGLGKGDDTLVSEIMAGSALYARPDMRLSDLARLMCANKVSALPVVAEEILVGIISTSDLLDHCVDTLWRDLRPVRD